MDLLRLTRLVDIGVLMQYVLVIYSALAYHSVIGTYIEALAYGVLEEQLRYEPYARPEALLLNNTFKEAIVSRI